MKVTLLVVLVFVAVALAERTVVSHENRYFSPRTWRQLEQSSADKSMDIGIFIYQRNLHALHEEFEKLTTPGSPEWRHWKPLEEIKQITAPTKAEMLAVRLWLASAGIDQIEDRIDAFKVTASIEQLSKLLDTTFYDFEHIETGTVVSRQFGSYSIPSKLNNIVQFITGVSEFPFAARKFSYSRGSRDDLEGKVVPYVIDQLYGIPFEDKSQVTKTASVGVVEYQGDNSFAQSDLTYFQQQNNLPQQQVPTSQIIGPYNPNRPDGEATLDIEYAWGVSYNTNAWYWTVEGWLLDFALAFQAASSRPDVISMSWGWTETNQCEIASCSSSQSYVERCNTEFQQITLSGVTITASSGDQGAPGDGDDDCRNNQQPLSSIFPGASPYVLSIGATMLVDSDSKRDVSPDADQPVPPVCSVYTCADTTTMEEVACSYPEALITTGGGFSNYSPRPSWQNSVVTNYLQTVPPADLPPALDFNATNRGFPDVSALGHNYLIRRDNSWEDVDGTSCSAPVWAALIALWNDYEQTQGRPTLGFINPLIYQIYGNNTATFFDIENGNNKCTESKCCEYGYTTAPGWDPVTGLGSPNFQKLYSAIQGQSASLFVKPRRHE